MLLHIITVASTTEVEQWKLPITMRLMRFVNFIMK